MDEKPELPKSGFVTAEFVRERYSIANATLYAWIAESRRNGGNGFPPPIRIGPRAVRWRSEDLRAFEGTFANREHAV